MKNQIKIIVAALAVAALFTACSASAADQLRIDPSTPVNSALSSTNIVNGGLYPSGIGSETTMTNIYAVINNPTKNDVQLEFSSACTASSTTNTVIVVARSVTQNSITNAQGLGPNMKFEPFLTWTVPQNGTTRVTYTTNLTKANSMGGFPYYYVFTIKSGAGGILTNYTVKASVQ